MNKRSIWFHAAALLICIIHVLPFYILLTASFKAVDDLSSKWISPGYVYLDNFVNAWREAHLGTAFTNNLFITLCAGVLIVALGSIASYPLARHQSRLNKLIYTIFISALIVPPLMTLVVTVKELYYRMLLEIEQFAQLRQLKLFLAGSTDSMLWDLVSRCQYLNDVQELLRQTLSHLKEAVSERIGATTAAKIMKFIHLHYADEDLSVTGIGSEMQMTASHLIAIFKETTGTTIKQYLMEYRVEKAKELLIDNPRLKVFDVASRVGYKDGENFAKIFRKFAGMTPSEYRERYGR